MSIAQELGDKHTINLVMGNMGIVYQRLGEYAKVFECLQRKLSIAEELGDKESIGTAIGNMGNAYFEQNSPERAVAFFEQAITIHRDVGFKFGLIVWLYQLAEIKLGTKEFLVAKRRLMSVMN